MKSMSAARRGVVLLFTIAILSILAILATTFTHISRMERDVSRNYVDHVRAKLLAQAGVERAAQEIRTAIQGLTLLPANFSGAEDVSKPWIYGKPMSGGTVFYEPTIPIERAIFCSFSWNTLTNSNRTVRLADRVNQKAVPANPLDSALPNDVFGVSGAMSGTYTQNGDFYSLKVIDSASKICINGPDSNDDNPNPAIAATATRLMDQLVNLLNNLSVILAQEKGLAFSDLGTRISNLRTTTARNFMRPEEIKSALGATLAQQEAAFDIVRSYISTAAWMDSGTLSPDSLEHRYPEVNGDPNLVYNGGWRTTRTVDLPNKGGTRTADATMPDGPTQQYACPTTSGYDRHVSDVPGWWMGERNPGATQTPPPGNPTTMECRTPRVPVNINTAPREVLQAVLTNIQGGYLNRMSNPTDWLGNGYDAANGTTVTLSPGTGGLANRIALALVQRRNELVRSARGYGFATWYDFDSFMDAIDSNAALSALVPPSTVSPVMLDGNPIRAKAIKDTVKANANPNSHINKFNPDRAFGSRFGDTDKADLKVWTTEFCFNSDGSFEIESIGRVCQEPNGAGAMPIVAETVIRTSMRVFEVYRISTQREFIANQIGGSGAGVLVTYPEHMSDIGGNNQSSRTAAAADYDGYLMLDTSDTNQNPGSLSFFANYDTDLEADAAGPAEQGTSLVSNLTGGNPSSGAQSELFTDGYFNHRTRRYASYSDIGGAGSWGAVNIGAIDEYVRNGRADQKIRMQDGTIDMWVKPAWAATGYSPAAGETPDFATQQSNSADNPNAVSRRTLFSVGQGENGSAYPMGGSSLETSDNRIYLYATYDRDGVYMMGSHGTRLCNVPRGLISAWPTSLDMGAHNVIDRSSQSRNHTNWVRLRGDADADTEAKYSVSTNSWNPRKWRYAGGWHHVRMCWTGQTAWLFVDGQPGGDDPLTSFRAPSVRPDISQAWSLFVGSNRFKDDETNGFPCNVDATIDDVKIYRTSISSSAFTPPQRYVSSGVYEGKIGRRTNVLDSNVQPMNGAGRVACVSWTVNMPRFNGTPTSCVLEIGKGGSYTAVSPNMTGVPPELAGRGTRVSNLNLVAGEDITYRLTMTSGLPDQVASPILDDVTVMVIPSTPRFLYYSIE